MKNSEDRNIEDYVMAIVGWGRVEVLLRFDLSLSRAQISHDKILKKLKMGVQDEYILKLYHSLLSLPILDKDGTDWSTKGIGLPDASFLASLLINFYEDELDRSLEAKFPKLRYARYSTEGFIAISKEEAKWGLKAFWNYSCN